MIDAELNAEDLAWERAAEPKRVGERLELVWQRLRPNRPLVAGIGLLGAFVLVAIAAVARFGDSLERLTVDSSLILGGHAGGPTLAHPFGQMSGLGVDVLASLFQSTPFDLALFGGTIGAAFLIGVLLGGAAGFLKGPADAAVTIGGDILVGVPPFFLVMVLFLGLQRLVPVPDDLFLFGGLFVVVLWPYYARPVRARALQVSTQGFVEAARAAGAPAPRLLTRHVIPNSLFPALAQVPVDLYNIFFVLTVFPFLGCFGGGSNGFFAPLSPLPSPSFPEWGNLLAAGACYGWSPLPELNAWWMYVFPAMVIVLFGISVTLTCDGVERLLRTGRSG